MMRFQGPLVYFHIFIRLKESKTIMNLKSFATIYSLMKDMNLIDSCQAHLLVKCALNIKFIRQK